MPLSASFVLRVPYGATDQMGVVYYANYLNWFESGERNFAENMACPTSIGKKKVSLCQL